MPLSTSRMRPPIWVMRARALAAATLDAIGPAAPEPSSRIFVPSQAPPPPADRTRAAGRGGTAEPSFEEKGFLERVATVYAAIVRPWLGRVDGNRAPEAVLAAALGRIRPVIAVPSERI